MVRIANVVGSGNLGIELDIERVEKDLDVPFSEYDPANYHGLYVRIREGGPLITVYRTGKYIISGCSDFEELYELNDEFLNRMMNLDGIEKITNTGFSIQNIVSTGDLDQELDLNVLSIGLGLASVEYEPEQFPGLIYRPSDYPVVFLLFANGKVVITGATDLSIVENAFSDLKFKIETLSGN